MVYLTLPSVTRKAKFFPTFSPHPVISHLCMDEHAPVDMVTLLIEHIWIMLFNSSFGKKWSTVQANWFQVNDVHGGTWFHAFSTNICWFCCVPAICCGTKPKILFTVSNTVYCHSRIYEYLSWLCKNTWPQKLFSKQSQNVPWPIAWSNMAPHVWAIPKYGQASMDTMLCAPSDVGTLKKSKWRK